MRKWANEDMADEVSIGVLDFYGVRAVGGEPGFGGAGPR